jgi:hypothetical protein
MKRFPSFPKRALHRLAGALAGLVLLAPSAAYADLMLYPTRIVIKGNQRSAQVEIINRSAEPETYRLTIVNRRMTETGEIVEAQQVEAGEQFADKMLVYTPRQVTLQPGEAQTVRVSVRRPAGLADGEYRSHLQFDRVAKAAGASDIENLPAPEEGQVSIALQALIGASIPVIVRHGQTSASTDIGDVAVIPGDEKAAPALSFLLRRQGNQSVYGDVVATYIPVGGRPLEVGRVSGVAVYVPNLTRTARIPLTLPEGLSLTEGSIRLTYSDRPESGGSLIAEATIDLP